MDEIMKDENMPHSSVSEEDITHILKTTDKALTNYNLSHSNLQIENNGDIKQKRKDALMKSLERLQKPKQVKSGDMKCNSDGTEVSGLNQEEENITEECFDNGNLNHLPATQNQEDVEESVDAKKDSHSNLLEGKFEISENLDAQCNDDDNIISVKAADNIGNSDQCLPDALASLLLEKAEDTKETKQNSDSIIKNLEVDKNNSQITETIQNLHDENLNENSAECAHITNIRSDEKMCQSSDINNIAADQITCNNAVAETFLPNTNSQYNSLLVKDEYSPCSKVSETEENAVSGSSSNDFADNDIVGREDMKIVNDASKTVAVGDARCNVTSHIDEIPQILPSSDTSVTVNEIETQELGMDVESVNKITNNYNPPEALPQNGFFVNKSCLSDDNIISRDENISLNTQQLLPNDADIKGVNSCETNASCPTNTSNCDEEWQMIDTELSELTDKSMSINVPKSCLRRDNENIPEKIKKHVAFKREINESDETTLSVGNNLSYSSDASSSSTSGTDISENESTCAECETIEDGTITSLKYISDFNSCSQIEINHNADKNLMQGSDLHNHIDSNDSTIKDGSLINSSLKNHNNYFQAPKTYISQPQLNLDFNRIMAEQEHLNSSSRITLERNESAKAQNNCNNDDDFWNNSDNPLGVLKYPHFGEFWEKIGALDEVINDRNAKFNSRLDRIKRFLPNVSKTNSNTQNAKLFHESESCVDKSIFDYDPDVHTSKDVKDKLMFANFLCSILQGDLQSALEKCSEFDRARFVMCKSNQRSLQYIDALMKRVEHLSDNLELQSTSKDSAITDHVNLLKSQQKDNAFLIKEMENTRKMTDDFRNQIDFLESKLRNLVIEHAEACKQRNEGKNQIKLLKSELSALKEKDYVSSSEIMQLREELISRKVKSAEDEYQSMTEWNSAPARSQSLTNSQNKRVKNKKLFGIFNKRPHSHGTECI